jgi:hypothetical protein
MDSVINLGQFPRRTFEDIRLQTQRGLDSCDPSYFFHYPSHPGNVIRQLHTQLAGFSRFVTPGGFRCLVWGRAGDAVHLHKYFSQFLSDAEVHVVVSDEEDLRWVEAQIPATVWLESTPDHYCSPPYIPAEYFNCVIIMGDSRRECLDGVDHYRTKENCCLLVVDEEPPFCDLQKGYYCLGGPVWRSI